MRPPGCSRVDENSSPSSTGADQHGRRAWSAPTLPLSCARRWEDLIAVRERFRRPGGDVLGHSLRRGTHLGGWLEGSPGSKRETASGTAGPYEPPIDDDPDLTRAVRRQYVRKQVRDWQRSEAGRGKSSCGRKRRGVPKRHIEGGGERLKYWKNLVIEGFLRWTCPRGRSRKTTLRCGRLGGRGANIRLIDF